MMITFILICKAFFLLIAAYPILSILRMTYVFVRRKSKKLYWAVPVSLLAMVFYVWIVSLAMNAFKG